MSKMRGILERHADGADKITIERVFANHSEDLDAEQFDSEYMVLTGSAESFKFLASVLNEFSTGTQGCTWGFHPQGAGSAHFQKDTKVGFYLKMKPCEEGPNNADA